MERIENFLNESECNVSSFEHSFEGDHRTFKLVISDNNWTQIKPVAKQYSNRCYLKLKPGEWSNVFAAKIWEQVKLLCAFTLKNAKNAYSQASMPNALCDLTLYAKNVKQYCKVKSLKNHAMGKMRYLIVIYLVLIIKLFI